MKKLLLLILLLFLCSSGINSYAQKKTHWLTDRINISTQLAQANSFPVSTVIDTTHLLMKSLPEYQFDIELAQSPRIARLLNKLPNSCSPNRIKTPERLKDNTYSLPLSISLGLRLYFKESKAATLPKNAFNDEQQLISLPSLFTDKSTYTLGIEKGRSYGVFLDAEIGALEKHNLVVRSGGESIKSLVKMLFKTRIDYMIEYPVGIKQALKDRTLDITLDSLRIANSPDYIVGYVACHKGSLGEEIIEDINKELLQLYSSYSFYQAHIRYLDKADLVNFNRAYQIVFKVAIPLKGEH